MTDIDIREGDQIDLDVGEGSEDIGLDVEESSESVDLDIEHNTGVSDYNMLTGKPILNGVTVSGDKVSYDYRVQDRMDILQNWEIDQILYGG